MNGHNDNFHGLSGTPWHVGYVKKGEDDPRRDKRICIYYNNGRCNFRFESCIGSSHCPNYKRGGQETLKKMHREKLSRYSEKISIPNLLQKSDTVTIFCSQTKHRYTFTIPTDSELAPIHIQCLGKRLNDKFNCNGFSYQIVSLQKGN